MRASSMPARCAPSDSCGFKCATLPDLVILTSRYMRTISARRTDIAETKLGQV